MDSLDFLRYFKKNYLNNNNYISLLNYGLDFCNEISEIFSESNWQYFQLDDLIENVCDENFMFDYGFEENYDAIISVNFLNRLNFFWLNIVQFERILKFNGYLCMIVPNKQHSTSLDKYIFSRNSIISLASYANLNIIKICENEFGIFLIAQKITEEQKLLYESSENELLKSKQELILANYDNRLKTLKEQYSEFNEYNFQIKSDLLNILSPNNVYCPICQSRFDEFLPFGKPPRRNAQCSKCGSLERHRFIYLFLNEKTEIFIKNSKILHFNPINTFKDLFGNMRNITYVTTKGIDGNTKKYNDNEFDCVLNFHVLDKVPNDVDVMKELYRIVKPAVDGGFVLINVPVLREKTLENETYDNVDLKEEHYHDSNRFRIYGKDIKSRLESVGFIVEEYTPDNFLNSKLVDVYGVIPDVLYLCKK